MDTGIRVTKSHKPANFRASLARGKFPLAIVCNRLFSWSDITPNFHYLDPILLQSSNQAISTFFHMCRTSMLKPIVIRK